MAFGSGAQTCSHSDSGSPLAFGTHWPFWQTYSVADEAPACCCRVAVIVATVAARQASVEDVFANSILMVLC